MPVATELLSARFASGPLDDMISGTVELSVPLRSDVIQVGAGGDAGVGRIRVAKEPDSITVTRVDRRPIQVDIVYDEQGTRSGIDPAARRRSPRSRVFDSPIPEVRLMRIRDDAGQSRWQLDGECGSVGLLKQFVDVVGTFAVAKQRRVAAVSTCSADVVTIVD